MEEAQAGLKNSLVLIFCSCRHRF